MAEDGVTFAGEFDDTGLEAGLAETLLVARVSGF